MQSTQKRWAPRNDCVCFNNITLTLLGNQIMTEPVDVAKLAVALIGENALVQAGDTQYQLNEQNALNASIDTVVDLIVKMVNELLKEFYPEILINISAPRCLDICSGQLIPDTFLSFSSSSVGGSPPLKV